MAYLFADNIDLRAAREQEASNLYPEALKVSLVKFNKSGEQLQIALDSDQVAPMWLDLLAMYAHVPPAND